MLTVNHKNKVGKESGEAWNEYLRTHGISIIRELVRNAEMGPQPRQTASEFTS